MSCVILLRLKVILLLDFVANTLLYLQFFEIYIEVMLLSVDNESVGQDNYVSVLLMSV